MPLTNNLTTMKHKGLHLLGAISVLALMLPATSASASAQSELAEANGGSESIEGTWICSIDRITQGITFTALMSFTAGGVALATGSIDRQPPPPISPIYGSWKRTGPNRVDVTIYFFIFDALGTAVGTIKNDESFHLDGQNHLSGSGAAYICDVQGENCKNLGSPIKITAKRVVPEGVEE
jgi:hypothetical protein